MEGSHTWKGSIALCSKNYAHAVSFQFPLMSLSFHHLSESFLNVREKLKARQLNSKEKTTSHAQKWWADLKPGAQMFSAVMSLWSCLERVENSWNLQPWKKIIPTLNTAKWLPRLWSCVDYTQLTCLYPSRFHYTNIYPCTQNYTKEHWQCSHRTAIMGTWFFFFLIKLHKNSVPLCNFECKGMFL